MRLLWLTAVVLSTRDPEVDLNVVIASFKRRRVEYAQASMHSRTSAFVDLDVDQLLGCDCNDSCFTGACRCSASGTTVWDGPLYDR
jgi:hypothetical protein